MPVESQPENYDQPTQSANITVKKLFYESFIWNGDMPVITFTKVLRLGVRSSHRTTQPLVDDESDHVIHFTGWYAAKCELPHVFFFLLKPIKWRFCRNSRSFYLICLIGAFQFIQLFVTQVWIRFKNTLRMFLLGFFFLFVRAHCDLSNFIFSISV